MGLETGTYVSDLTETNPLGTDAKSAGDNHLRLLKDVLKNTFPTADKAFQLRGGVGLQAASEITIAAGVVTPVNNRHTVDTEIDAASDDLANIVTTNIPDGGLLILRAENDARTVVVKHESGGAGQISLSDDVDFSLDASDKLLILERSGADWNEITRDYGADTLGKAAYSGVPPTPVTTRGDIVRGNASGAEERLALGTVNYELTSDGTDVVWTERPLSIAKSPPEMSNGSTGDDIDVTVGSCLDDAQTANLVVASAIGKGVDGTWVTGGTPGTPTGGRASSVALANVWYHMFLGKVAGTVEAGFDTSIVGAALVADHSFTNLRYIGSAHRVAGAFRDFFQAGDDFYWKDRSTPDFSATLPSGGALQVVATPLGFKTTGIFIATANTSVSSSFALFTSPEETDVAASGTHHDWRTVPDGRTPCIHFERLTNTASQIRIRGTTISTQLWTVGYRNRRGRDG